MARKAVKEYDEEDMEEEFEEDEEDEEEEEEEVSKARKKKSKKKSSESEIKYFPRAVSTHEMLNENYLAVQEAKQLGKDILKKVNKIVDSIE